MRDSNMRDIKIFHLVGFHWINKSGQSLVEMAFVTPLFLGVILGGIEFGRVLYEVQALNRVAQEAAVVAATGDLSNIQTVAQATANSKLAIYPFSSQVQTSVQVPADLSASPLTVTLTKPISTYFGTLIPGLNNLSYSATAPAYIGGNGKAETEPSPGNQGPAMPEPLAQTGGEL